MISANHTWRIVISFIFIGLIFSGCSDFRRAIGKEKSSPDEFEVVVRPSLSLPPQFGVRPVAGEDIPARHSGRDAVSQTVQLFSARTGVVTGFDELFAFAQIEPNIRTKIDEETAGILYERRLPIQVIFGGVPQVGPVIDKMAEDRRLRRNRLQKKPINAGATPAIDQVLNEPVLIE